MLKFAVLDSVSGMIELAEEWDQFIFELKTVNFNYLHDWYLSYILIHGANKRLKILIFRNEEDKIIGIVPLQIRRYRYKSIFPMRHAEFIADGQSDWNDFLCKYRQEEIIRTSVQYLLNDVKCSEIILHDIQENSKSKKILENIDFKGVRKIFKQQSFCYFIETTGDFNSYLLNSTSKQYIQQDIRRLHRKLESYNIEHKLFMSDFKDNNKDLMLMKKMHIQSQGRKGRRSFFEDEVNIKYYLEIISRLKNYCRLYYYYFNEIPVAYVFGFYFQHVFYYWNIGFNTDYKEFSPSKLLLFEIIKSCFLDETCEFNFMKGNTEYKSKWTKTYRMNFQVKMLNKKGLAGMINKFRNIG